MHTAIKDVCRHIHSPHKISARDVLRSPFPIELPEPRPVGGDRLSPGVLALCFSNLNAFTLTPVMFFVDIVSDLSGVLLRCFTLSVECGMFDIKPVPLRFQLVGLLQKVKHRRRFAVNSIFLDMLPDVLDRLLVVLDCGSIFLLETALRQPDLP